MAALISFRDPPEGRPIAIGLISYYLYLGLLAYISLGFILFLRFFFLGFPLALFCGVELALGAPSTPALVSFLLLFRIPAPAQVHILLAGGISHYDHF